MAEMEAQMAGMGNEPGSTSDAANAPGNQRRGEHELLNQTISLLGDGPLVDRSQAAHSLQADQDSEEERVLLEHLPIVRFLARRIHERLPQHVDIDDLVSAGVVGLLDAFAKFDSTKKVQFRSYAQFRIRGAILDSLRILDWSPRELRRKGRAVEDAVRSVTLRLGRAPSENEVAEEMGTTLGAYQQLLGDLKGLEIGTLHIERNEDSGEEELAYIPGRPEEDPLFRCLRGELEGRLIGAIQDLPDRERLVMTLYYYEEMTMREIGMALGVVESRVSQIHASAVVHLRAALSDFSSRDSRRVSRARRNGAKLSEQNKPLFAGGLRFAQAIEDSPSGRGRGNSGQLGTSSIE
jgi:RNA polymerase sigma factor for flagellar operon FliA